MADFYGTKVDFRIRPEGDGGVDNVFFTRITGRFAWIDHDAKCASFAKELWTGVDSPRPTKPDCIYVLHQHEGRLDARPLGWEWGHEMLKCPKKLTGEGRQKRWVYYKSAYLLRPMSDLKEYYCNRWRWHQDPEAPRTGYPAEYPPEPAPFVRPIIRCHICGGDGLYGSGDKYLCNEHRVW